MEECNPKIRAYVSASTIDLKVNLSKERTLKTECRRDPSAGFGQLVLFACFASFPFQTLLVWGLSCAWTYSLRACPEFESGALRSGLGKPAEAESVACLVYGVLG